MATARAAGLLVGFILSAVILMPLQWFGVKFGFAYARSLPNRYHRFLCWLVGIRVTVRGEPYRGGACLITANHTSWLDIPIIASLAPCSFVAKSEVAAGPFLARWRNCSGPFLWSASGAPAPPIPATKSMPASPPATGWCYSPKEPPAMETGCSPSRAH